MGMGLAFTQILPRTDGPNPAREAMAEFSENIKQVPSQLLSAPVPDPVPGLPVGWRLRSVAHHWREIFDDPWTISVVQHGFRIPLKASPPLVLEPLCTRSEPKAEKTDAVLWEVSALVSKGAVIRLENPVPCPGFYSHMFLVEKASGGWRPVLDLSNLNVFVTAEKFHMETAATVIDSVHRDDWLASIDLADAYLHIPIHAQSRHLLRFTVQGGTYEFQVLPSRH